MALRPAGYEDRDISVASGRLRVRRWGAADAPAVVCVPGLSANLCGFDRLAEQLAGDTLQLLAIDLRGRGRSEGPARAPMAGATTHTTCSPSPTPPVHRRLWSSASPAARPSP